MLLLKSFSEEKKNSLQIVVFYQCSKPHAAVSNADFVQNLIRNNKCRQHRRSITIIDFTVSKRAASPSRVGSCICLGPLFFKNLAQFALISCSKILLKIIICFTCNLPFFHIDIFLILMFYSTNSTGLCILDIARVRANRTGGPEYEYCTNLPVGFVFVLRLTTEGYL